MIHLTKDEYTLMHFALEILASNSKLYEIKRIGVDMESTTYNGFKKVIPSISRLVCVQHLKARDESTLSKLQEKTGRSSADKQHALSDILKDIYGSRNGNLYEYGLAEAMDIEDFDVKLDSLQRKWEGLCFNFYNWLLSKRKGSSLKA